MYRVKRSRTLNVMVFTATIPLSGWLSVGVNVPYEEWRREEWYRHGSGVIFIGCHSWRLFSVDACHSDKLQKQIWETCAIRYFPRYHSNLFHVDLLQWNVTYWRFPRYCTLSWVNFTSWGWILADQLLANVFFVQKYDFAALPRTDIQQQKSKAICVIHDLDIQWFESFSHSVQNIDKFDKTGSWSSWFWVFDPLHPIFKTVLLEKIEVFTQSVDT